MQTPLNFHFPQDTHTRYTSISVNKPVGQQVLDIGDGLKVQVCLGEADLYLGSDTDFPWYVGHMPQHEGAEPLVSIKVVGKAHTKVVEREYEWHQSRLSWLNVSGRYTRQKITQEDCYTSQDPYRLYQHDPADPKRRAFLYLMLDVTLPDGTTQQAEVRFRQPTVGNVTIGQHTCGKPKLDINGVCYGYPYTFTEDFHHPLDNNGGYLYLHDTATPLAILARHLKGSTIQGGKEALWAAFLGQWHDDTKTPMDGIGSVYKRKDIAPNIARLEKDAPLDWTFFRWLHNNATSEGKRNNQLLSVMFQTVGTDYDKLVDALRTAREKVPDLTTSWMGYRDDKGPGFPLKRAICETLPGAAEKIQAIAAAKDFRKASGLAAQAEGLGVLADKYPLLRAAIEGGHIPIGVFNQPTVRGADGQPVNREFRLWERALGQKGWAETIYEIAANAASRSTYERDITPYLMFLFRICQYLDKHAPRGKGKGWQSKPKFVQSQWELEMDDDANENGTQKRRSAFTPVADNETGTVEVPYVAVAVTGVRTQWCYSRYFYIFEEGFTDPESGGVVLQDLEPKLNGRDDYGLMYYTLTGTDTARGYPTFLIIFEKRATLKVPFVHFHRVRPCRSKDGVKTPACNLIEACYQYMAGNIPAAEITAQQGDLIFIKMGHNPIEAKAKVEPDSQSSPVLVFESHALQSLNADVPLTLHRSAAKTPQNRLGFVYAPSGLRVGHPEHDDIEGLVEGWYEIRRCKSWEANPKAIWSMTID